MLQRIPLSSSCLHLLYLINHLLTFLLRLFICALSVPDAPSGLDPSTWGYARARICNVSEKRAVDGGSECLSCVSFSFSPFQFFVWPVFGGNETLVVMCLPLSGWDDS